MPLFPEGLLIPTVEELQESLAEAQRADVDPLIETSADSLQGQENGIFASHLREAYEILQLVFDALDPNNAEDALLENVSAITGTTRKAATKSTFRGSRRIVVNLNAGVTLPAGSVASVVGAPQLRFVTTENATNSGGSPANILVAAESEDFGPVHANATTLTVIATPVTGWNSVNNPTDPVLGALEENDEQLRVRREAELRAPGNGNVDAIRADLIALVEEDGTKPIIEAVVYENPTDTTINGMLPHSVDAVIWDGPGADATNDLVAQTIFDSKAAGIYSNGVFFGTVTDSYGNQHLVRFNRATQRQVTIEVTLKYLDGLYVGDAAVETAIADAFQTPVAGIQGPPQKPGQDVSFSVYMAVVQRLAGVTRITNWRMHLDGDPFTAFDDLEIDLREIAVTDTSIITIVSTPEVLV